MNPDVPNWFAIGCMVLGIVAVFRAALVVATNSAGRFPGDAFLTLVAGFGLLCLGQYFLAS